MTIHSYCRLLLFSGSILLVGCDMGFAQNERTIDKKPALKEVLSADCKQRSKAVLASLDESESRSFAGARASKAKAHRYSIPQGSQTIPLTPIYQFEPRNR